MSVCDEGWGTDDVGGEKRCPVLECCGAYSWCGLEHYEHISNGERPDSCPYAPILKALPSATEEQLSIIEAVLSFNSDWNVYLEWKDGKGNWTDKEISYRKDTPCPTCGGSGERHSKDGWEYQGKCPTCQGKGEV